MKYFKITWKTSSGDVVERGVRGSELNVRIALYRLLLMDGAWQHFGYDGDSVTVAEILEAEFGGLHEFINF